MKLTDFLKPNSKKIMVLLLLLVSYIPLIIHNFSFPAQFSLLNDYIYYLYYSNYYTFFPSAIVACSLGYFDCQPALVSESTLNIILVFVGVLLWYPVSCLIVSCWNWFFSSFGEKKKHYEKFAAKTLLIGFIFIAVVLPTIGNNFIDIETITSRSLIGAGEGPIGLPILQELIVKNKFILPVTYQLPDLTACSYDTKINSTIDATTSGDFYLSYYIADTGRSVVDSDKTFNRNVITIKPLSEKKIFLVGSIYGWGVTDMRESFINTHKNDEIILLKNIGMNNEKYCSSFSATDTDIHSSEKIKISE
jgi:hypothetical protein